MDNSRYSGMGTMTKEELLYKIQCMDFVKVETELYLDSHPECMSALENYKNVVSELKKLITVYENTYGPIFKESAADERWTWVDSPWPWQNNGK